MFSHCHLHLQLWLTPLFICRLFYSVYGIVLLVTQVKWSRAYMSKRSYPTDYRRNDLCTAFQNISNQSETNLHDPVFYSLYYWNKIHKNLNDKSFIPSAIWMAFKKRQNCFFSLLWLFEWIPEKSWKEGWNSVSVMEFSIHPHKWECREIWHSCACSPRGKFFTYIWLCIVSIPQLAMRISASPSLIQAGHRGCQISRAILKYSTAVRD